MKLKVAFWTDQRERRAEFGPYDWVVATDREIRVPIDLDVMDEEAEEFREFSQSVSLSFDNLLAVRQQDGSWELREMAGRDAYEVFMRCRTVKSD